MKIIAEKSTNGFTLVELLVTMVVTIIIAGSAFISFKSQDHSYTIQDEIVEMQQNLRAALFILTREIRMAGYDPTGLAGARITEALPGSISFTQDLNEDGNCNGTNENILFGLQNDTNSTGIVGPDGVLGRNTGGGLQPIAENIQAIEFYYTLADGTNTTSPSNPDNIRTVKVSILACARQPDRDYTNTKTYTTVSNATWGPYNDNYRRRFLITTIKCRNMGIN